MICRKHIFDDIHFADWFTERSVFMLFIRDVTELIASTVSDADVDRNPYILCMLIDMWFGRLL